MTRKPVDLANHLNQTIARGHPADFPVALAPLQYSAGTALAPVPHRLAVVREDTGAVLGVVSDRYTLVPHQRILDLVQEAIAPLDLEPVPRGVYVDRQGARMRAIFKFPALAQPVVQGDDICPCLKIRNTYDGTSRISIHIGAFRFVCTNLAVGGGGIFAGGFMSVHAGEIPIEDVGRQLRSYLSGFDAILDLYRHWSRRRLEDNSLEELLASMPRRPARAISDAVTQKPERTVYDAYNAATFYATHETRSYRSAFGLLEHVNRSFQERFPLPPA